MNVYLVFSAFVSRPTSCSRQMEILALKINRKEGGKLFLS